MKIKLLQWVKLSLTIIFFVASSKIFACYDAMTLRKSDHESDSSLKQNDCYSSKHAMRHPSAGDTSKNQYVTFNQGYKILIADCESRCRAKGEECQGIIPGHIIDINTIDALSVLQHLSPGFMLSEGIDKDKIDCICIKSQDLSEKFNTLYRDFKKNTGEGKFTACPFFLFSAIVDCWQLFIEHVFTIP